MQLIDGKSLLQLTLERVSLLSQSVICVASEDHRFLVSEAMQAAKVPGTVLLEPVARNTAAAMAIAALVAHPADLLLFCPPDHHIPDAAAFAQAVKQGVAAAEEGAIVTFGISPTFPSTAYGYIPLGVKHRLENPGKSDLELIEVQSGNYLGEDDIVLFEDTYGRDPAVESA